MTRMTGPDCADMCNLINTDRHTLIPNWDDQCEWHIMTRMTGPDCAVMCNLVNTHTHTHTHTHRTTRMTGPDCAVMCNLINTHTHTHTGGGVGAGVLDSENNGRIRWQPSLIGRLS